MVRFAAFGALATMGIALGCGGKSATNTPSGPEPSVAVLRCTAPSEPTVIHQGFVTGLAVVGAQALFVDGSLLSVPLAGGATATLVAGNGNGMGGLVATSDTVFFTATHPEGAVTPEGKQSSEVALYSVPITGGSSTFIRDRFSFNQGAADSTSAYLADVLGKVLKFTPPDVAPVEMAIGDKLGIRALTVNSTDIFAAVQDFVLPAPSGGILKIPKGGGPARVIVTTAGLPNDIAADDSAVFWIEDPPIGTFGEGHISGADLDGGHVASLVAHGGTALAVDASYLYVLSDSLSRVPKTGGALEPLAGGFSGAGMLRVAGADAVWIDHYTKALSDPTPSSLISMCLHGTAGP